MFRWRPFSASISLETYADRRDKKLRGFIVSQRGVCGRELDREERTNLIGARDEAKSEMKIYERQLNFESATCTPRQDTSGCLLHPREDYWFSSAIKLPTWAHSISETLV